MKRIYKWQLHSKWWFQWALWRYDACRAAREWCKGKTLQEAWDTCEYGSWMAWWIHFVIDPHYRIGGRLAQVRNEAVSRHYNEGEFEKSYELVQAEAIRARFGADGSRIRQSASKETAV